MRVRHSTTTMRIDIRPDPAGEDADVVPFGEAGGGDAGQAERRIRTTDFQRLLHSIYDGVLLTDLDGKVVDCNSRACGLFRCEEHELEGTSVVDLISGAGGSLLTAIRRNLENHKYTLIEAHCLRADKSMFPTEVAVNRLEVNGGTELCFFIRDISVRRKAQAALEDAVARLEEHDRARSAFVSNVSHELRTPLTSMIYAVANMLRGVVGPLPDRVRGYLEILEGDCKRLQGTVNDILDLRKIDDKSITLSRIRAPFGRLVARSTESLRVQAERKSLTFSIFVGNRVWFVDCDAQKMERVILNVVGNAVKFTPDGGEVTVTLAEDPERAGNVLLTVCDTGIGVPAHALSRVTERYFTVGDQPSGSGLGLAIAREIVELHGGDLSIQSPVPGSDRGTCVGVSIPGAEAPRVLIVDDEEPVRGVLSEQLLAHGYQVSTAADGAEALSAIEEDRPDLVILDLLIPKIEGTELVLKMKSREELAHTPVIVVTGIDVDRAKAQILSSFAIPALQKPWREEELLDRVESAFVGAAAVNPRP